MKNIVTIIYGSPNNNGFTSIILNSFVDALKIKKNELKINFFDTYKLHIMPCDGCKHCATNGNCKYNDLVNFHKSISISELIIFSSPMYNLSFPAPMKMLLDRTQIYFSKKFILNRKKLIKKYKKSILIVSSGRDDKLGISTMERQTLLISNLFDAEYIGKIFLPSTDTLILNKETIYSKIQLAIENIICKI